jgi:hypothetical protein
MPDMYYDSFPKDRITLKIAIGWVNLIGVVQTTLVIIDSYKSLISFQMYCDPIAGSFAPLWRMTSYFYISIIGSSTAGKLNHFSQTSFPID